jgi:hypothetical protein
MQSRPKCSVGKQQSQKQLAIMHEESIFVDQDPPTKSKFGSWKGNRYVNRKNGLKLDTIVKIDVDMEQVEIVTAAMLHAMAVS